MSSNHSNPLLVDPSIVSIDPSHYPSKRPSKNNKRSQSHTSINNLDPSNALSKLLDSAMAHAAKENTPESYVDDNNNVDDSFNDTENSTENVSKSQVEDEFNLISSTIPPKKYGLPNIYTINHLLQLRDEIELIEFSDTLPDLSFWRLKPVREQGNGRSFNNNLNNTGEPFNNKSKKFRRHQHETWERNKSEKPHQRNNRHGFNKAQELESLSDEKISQLLGEVPDELDPEWDDDIIDSSKQQNGKKSIALDDSSKMSMAVMGQTVEDFEKWKYQMKLEERKKNGEIIDEEKEKLKQKEVVAALNVGNEVDNFFSFVKPSTKEESIISTSTPKDEIKQQGGNSQSNSRSSRFTSFFQEPSSSIHGIDSTEKSKNDGVSTPQSVSKPTNGPPPGFSKFFGGNNQASQASTPGSDLHSQPPHLQSRSSLPISQQQLPKLQQQTPTSNSASQIPLQQQQPQNSSSNDNFFLSLLKRKESTHGTSTDNNSPTNEGKFDIKAALNQHHQSQVPKDEDKGSTDNNESNKSPIINMQQQNQHQNQRSKVPPQQFSQNQHPHLPQQHPNFPPGIPLNQLPPWLLNGANLPPHLQQQPQQQHAKNFPPPGFQSQPVQQSPSSPQLHQHNDFSHQQPSQQQQNQGSQQHPQQSPQRQSQQFPFPPHAGSGNRGFPPQAPPPGLFPNGFIPPHMHLPPFNQYGPPPPGLQNHQQQPQQIQPLGLNPQSLSNQQPNHQSLPPHLLNNPNARFIPPQYLQSKGLSHPNQGPPPHHHSHQQQQHQPQDSGTS
ncbi:uncharacterized protein KGF55_004351 [Candida pseudojiufengensis]|uniref:uncharacterized protein n=1 Tax=Candida pseudojiufengensis TaxID=497109 RepID=UPI002224E918|nr:uncharacterized protein KGF55_004351 [Candida pseudojiufengensis]KAI5960781.1 hypothetical protein KGF55_004351 [Candida pseudojiufengensis]